MHTSQRFWRFCLNITLLCPFLKGELLFRNMMNDIHAGPANEKLKHRILLGVSDKIRDTVKEGLRVEELFVVDLLEEMILTG